MTADFAGRTGAALVVGGSGGLGRAIADLLATHGATVAVTYRTRVPEFARSAYRLDLTEAGAPAEVVGQSPGRSSTLTVGTARRGGY